MPSSSDPCRAWIDASGGTSPGRANPRLRSKRPPLIERRGTNPRTGGGDEHFRRSARACAAPRDPPDVPPFLISAGWLRAAARYVRRSSSTGPPRRVPSIVRSVSTALRPEERDSRPRERTSGGTVDGKPVIYSHRYCGRSMDKATRGKILYGVIAVLVVVAISYVLLRAVMGV